MNIAIDPKCRDWCVVKIFLEDAHDEIVYSDVGRLSGLSIETIKRNVQTQPISVELCHLLVSNG